MKSFKLHIHHIFLTVSSLLIIVLITACSDNPAGNDNHEHAEPFGLELIHDGDIIIEYVNGEVTEHQHMHFHVGEEYPFTIQFLNEDGEHIHAEDFDDDYSLGWIIGDENVLQIEQREEDGKWSFHLIGVAEGESNVQFSLMHGTDGSAHSDLETPDVDTEGAIEFHVDADDDNDDHNH